MEKTAEQMLLEVWEKLSQCVFCVSTICPVCPVCPVFLSYHFVCNRRLVAYQIDALMWKRRLPRWMVNAERWMVNGKWRVVNGGCAKQDKQDLETDRQTKFVRRPH